jgi:hypothetical protein
MKSIGSAGVISDRVSRYHGFPHLTSEELAIALFEEYRTKLNRENERCKSILNSLDSFPFGLVANGHDATQRDGHRGRAMNHADLINLQALDGILFNVKYLVLARNVTVRFHITHLSASSLASPPPTPPPSAFLPPLPYPAFP